MTKLEGVRVMKYFVIGSLLTAYLSIFHSFSFAQTTHESPVMQGFPPTRESQATMENYRQHPISQWTFSNAGWQNKKIK